MPPTDGSDRSSLDRRLQRAETMRVWHGRIGLLVAVLVAVVAVTGLILNHGETLDLDRTEIRASWLVDWYGLSPQEAPVHFRAGDAWVSWIDGAVYANGRRVAGAGGTPRGAIVLEDMVAVGTAEAVVVFTEEGELIERLGLSLLPGRPLRIGKPSGDLIVVETGDGRFASDSDLLTWNTFDGEADWSTPGTPPEAELERQMRAYRGQGLPLSRLLLDLHTGRLFGAGGGLVMDAVAVLMLVLAVTGIIQWVASRPPRR